LNLIQMICNHRVKPFTILIFTCLRKHLRLQGNLIKLDALALLHNKLFLLLALLHSTTKYVFTLLLHKAM